MKRRIDPLFKERKNVIRLILFLLAAGIAVFAFAHGILQLGHKEPGYYDVGLTAEGNAVLYGSGAHLLIYAEGSSSEIRLGLTQAQKGFTAALQRAWQLLDSRQTYEGVVNLASVNQSPGEAVRVGEVLYGILADALERTRRNEGYSLFSGILHEEWSDLRYLEEPASYDPVNSPQEAALLADMARLINAPGSLDVELIAPDSVRLVLSSECQAFVERQEIDAPPLDLNVLRDAYLLELTAAALKEQGITAGYLYTESGYSLWLEQSGEMRYDLYGEQDGQAETVAALSVSAPAAYCQFTAFSVATEPEKRYGYYALEDAGERYLRHPQVNIATGGFSDVLMTAGVASDSASLVDLGYAVAVLNAQPDSASVDRFLAGLPDSMIAYYTLQRDPQVIRATVPERIALYAGNGYTVELVE